MNWIRNVFDGKYSRLALVAGSVVILDQAAKAVILNALPLYDSVPVIPGFFNLTHIYNPGGAFGFLAEHGSGLRNLLFLTASSAAIGLVFYFYKNTPKTQPLLSTGFAMVLGGAVGNLIDRVRFGEVLDFLDFYIGNLHWPAFNIADSAISVGLGIFLIHLFLAKGRK